MTSSSSSPLSNRFRRSPLRIEQVFFGLLSAAVLATSFPAPLHAQDEGDPSEAELDPATLAEQEAQTQKQAAQEEADRPTIKPRVEPKATPRPKATPAPAAAKPAAQAAATVPAAAAAAPSGASPLVSVVGNNLKMSIALSQLSEALNGNVVSAYGKISEEKVSVMAEDVPIETALNMISNPKGWIWWKEDNGDYGIADRDYYEKNILPKRVIQKVFQPKNIKASELDKALKGLLTPNVGSSVADDRTNKLIVNDLPQALERIERFIREIDVQLVTRVFYISHADVEDVAKKIETYKSGPGTIELDVKTHQIIVTDLLSNIKKMELLIDILDVGPEIVIYDVNNIGIDGEDIDELQEIIDSIRTKDLLFEVKAKQGVFILEDVPEVHEKVEQILAGFDQPVKQVLIQSEILSTAFNRDFSLGVQRFAWAENLLMASSQGALSSGDPLPNPLDSTKAGTAPLAFTDFYRIFPNFIMNGDTLNGNLLTNQALVQYQASFSQSNTKVLLQPRLLVKNQQSSTIFVGEEVPYLTTYTDSSTVNNGGTNNVNPYRTTTQQTVTSGLRFDVTPSISNSYLVELDLAIDNDKAKPQDIPDGDQTRRVVGRERQNVETILQIPSGQTRMIGGLISNTDTQSNGGLPFLSTLPWIGHLFGVRTTNKNATNLLIFITPSIVEDVLPRQTSKDGRRGRLVTDYDRVPGDLDVGIGEDDEITTETLKLKAPELTATDLLSANAEEEARMLEEMKAQAAAEGKGPDSNYVPRMGTGSSTINTGGGTTPGGAERGKGGDQGGNAQPPQGAPGERRRGERRPGGGGALRPADPGAGTANPRNPTTRPETKYR